MTSVLLNVSFCIELILDLEEDKNKLIQKTELISKGPQDSKEPLQLKDFVAGHYKYCKFCHHYLLLYSAEKPDSYICQNVNKCFQAVVCICKCTKEQLQLFFYINIMFCLEIDYFKASRINCTTVCYVQISGNRCRTTHAWKT